MTKRSFTITAVLLLFVAAAPAQDSESARLIQQALQPSPLQSNLAQLTDSIGGRIPGTPAMQRAYAWGTDAFKAAGADSVHREDYSIQNSWAEGATQMKVVAPEEFVARVVSLAWAPALTPHQHVPVIDIGEGTPQDFARAQDLAGTILLVHSAEMNKWDDLFAEYFKAPGIIDHAVKAKALAIAFQSTRPRDLLYRHINTDFGDIDRIPQVLVAREDASRMMRLLASGQKLFADVSVPNNIGGPIVAENVIAEIRGTEKPSEFVVLGAHLDSWELGTGALDNGCNAALVIDTLRAIHDSGLHPRRSIRFVLFSGEEQGLLGSWAYVRAHRRELDNAAGVIVFDAGTGHVTGFSVGGRKEIPAAAAPMVAPLAQFGATTFTTDAQWGTDHFDFMLEGVPTFVANQDEANYLVNYHAMSDTYDKVDFDALKKHVADAAVLTFALANAPGRVGPRLSRAQVEQTLHDAQLDDPLKLFGIWQQFEKGERGRAQ